MTGWNLPPGCSVRDLPGNSAEDAAAEALIDELCSLDEQIADLNYFDKLSDWVLEKMGEAFMLGYQQGQSDEAMAREFKDKT